MTDAVESPPDDRYDAAKTAVVFLPPSEEALRNAIAQTAAEHLDTAAAHRSLNEGHCDIMTAVTQAELDARAKGTVAAVRAMVRALTAGIGDVDSGTVAAVADDLIAGARAQHPTGVRLRFRSVS